MSCITEAYKKLPQLMQGTDNYEIYKKNMKNIKQASLIPEAAGFQRHGQLLTNNSGLVNQNSTVRVKFKLPS